MTRFATAIILASLLVMGWNQAPPIPVERAATTPTQAGKGTTSSKPSPRPTASPGVFRLTEPDPLDLNDHEGYLSLFDGLSLKNWDGHPKFWRVENGAIIGESTAKNPSGNQYLVYRGFEAKDFTLKFEMKVDGKGGTGFQYRSKTGVPWLMPISPMITANVGPVNLNWMMTGPQADFWPSQIYTGQFYSENTPMRVIAWRGQLVESYGLARKRLMGKLGDRPARRAGKKRRLEPVHRDRARWNLHPHREWAGHGRVNRRRPRLVQQPVGVVRHRNRVDHETLREEYLGQETQLISVQTGRENM